MRKFLILGRNGLLGSSLEWAIESSNIGQVVNVPRIDITDTAGLSHMCEKTQPDYLINCVVFHNDPSSSMASDAEMYPERALEINGNAAARIADMCAAKNIKHVYISTDYVFSGYSSNGYKASDLPHPINTYGRSKVIGEKATIENNGYVVRTSSLIGRRINQNTFFQQNFVDKIIQRAKQINNTVEVVCDQTQSPSFTFDIAPIFIRAIVELEPAIYHITNHGYCTWYDLAVETFSKLNDKNFKVKPISVDKFPSNFQKPRNTVLVPNTGYDIRSWKEALRVYLQQYFGNDLK